MSSLPRREARSRRGDFEGRALFYFIEVWGDAVRMCNWDSTVNEIAGMFASTRMLTHGGSEC